MSHIHFVSQWPFIPIVHRIMTLHLPKKKKSFLVNINVFSSQDTLVMQTNDIVHTTTTIIITGMTIVRITKYKSFPTLEGFNVNHL